MKLRTLLGLALLMGVVTNPALSHSGGQPGGPHNLVKLCCVLPCTAEGTDGRVVVTGLREVLEQAIKASNAFSVVETNAGGVSAGSPAPQVFASATITSVVETSQAGQFPVGQFNAGIKVVSDTVSISLKVIDSRSQQVVSIVSAEGKASAVPLQLGYKRKPTDADGALVQTEASPSLLQAVKKALRSCVGKAIRDLNQDPWAAKVAGVDSSGHIFIAAGLNCNIHVGDRFRVERETQKIVDPDTQEVLGETMEPLGELQVTAVAGKYSVAFGVLGARPGDFVTEEIARR